MTSELEIALAVLGTAMVFSGLTWKVVTWLDTKIVEAKATATRAHERLDEFAKQAVQKDDLREHIARLERHIDRLSEQITAMSATISSLSSQLAAHEAAAGGPRDNCAPARRG